MYTPSVVNPCLIASVTLSDASIYAPTYLTTPVIGAAIPTGGNINTILASLLNGSATKLLGDVIRIKKLTNNVKSVLTDFSLFNGKADNSQKNSNQGRFVGLALTLKNNSDIALNIFQIALHADMAVPGMKFYLFNSDLSGPIQFPDPNNPPAMQDWIDFNYVKGLDVQWLTIKIPVTSDDGVYYLGYFETDLGGAQSIKKTMDYVNAPICTTCNENYYTQYMKRVRYLNVQPFYVDANNLNGTNLFDTDKVNYTDMNNWGINFKATVNCDISSFICRNVALFYDALSMRYCIDILNYLLMNTRNNAILEQIKDGIIFMRDGDKGNGTLGLTAKYEEIIEALNVDLSGFNELCLPCATNAYVKRAYIG